MANDVLEAKAALEKAKKDLEIQRAKWPLVRKIAQDIYDALEENHFSERLRIAQEGWREHH
jgi:hypothetical protein